VGGIVRWRQSGSRGGGGSGSGIHMGSGVEGYVKGHRCGGVGGTVRQH